MNALIAEHWPGWPNRRLGADRMLFVAAVVIVAWGLVMVASASVAVGQINDGASLQYFWKQLVFLLIGAAAALVMWCIPMAVWSRTTWAMFGLAVNATVAPRSVFARKNYFYPDLPKGYQISQYELPIVDNGELFIVGDDGEEKRIGITRAHLEEDAALAVPRQHVAQHARQVLAADVVALAQEHLAVPAQRRDAFLNPRPTGILQADNRRAVAHGHLLHLVDFLRMQVFETVLGDNVAKAHIALVSVGLTTASKKDIRRPN